MKDQSSDPVGLTSTPERRRGFLLTAWLTILSLGAVISAYYAVTETPVILEAFPDAPAELLWVKTALAVVNVLLFGAIWMWKRWAVYALGVSTILIFILNATANEEWLYFLSGLVGYGILLVLVRTGGHWSSFRQ